MLGLNQKRNENTNNNMRYIDYLSKVNHCKRETKVLVDFEKN